jgi:SAM-dependent methyltransferase
MLKRLKNLYGNLLQSARTLRRLEAAAYSTMSPIDRHIASQMATLREGVFQPSYHAWRATRINKMLELYGLEWFAGKRVIELGCGHADIGAFLAEIGASVLCVDGRQENLTFAKLKHRNVGGLEYLHADLDGEFPALGRCDLLIHFGLLYHLEDVDRHLAQCWALADEIVLESVVCDSLDPAKIVYLGRDKPVNSRGLHGKQNRPSPFYVERLATAAGYEIERCFTPDLNSGMFIYDWRHKDNGDLGGFAKRRMWRFHKPAQAARAPSDAGAQLPAAAE